MNRVPTFIAKQARDILHMHRNGELQLSDIQQCELDIVIAFHDANERVSSSELQAAINLIERY